MTLKLKKIIILYIYKGNSNIYLYVVSWSLGKVGKQFLRRTLAKRYTCQKKRKSSSNEPKLKSKRPKRNNNADEDYGHADPLDNLKDVNDEQFINEMNEFVRFLYYCCQYKYTYLYS